MSVNDYSLDADTIAETSTADTIAPDVKSVNEDYLANTTIKVFCLPFYCTYICILTKLLYE
jgi:hypothetical protein